MNGRLLRAGIEESITSLFFNKAVRGGIPIDAFQPNSSINNGNRKKHMRPNNRNYHLTLRPA